jgi:hypothetical protein
MTMMPRTQQQEQVRAPSVSDCSSDYGDDHRSAVSDATTVRGHHAAAFNQRQMYETKTQPAGRFSVESNYGGVTLREGSPSKAWLVVQHGTLLIIPVAFLSL